MMHATRSFRGNVEDVDDLFVSAIEIVLQKKG